MSTSISSNQQHDSEGGHDDGIHVETTLLLPRPSIETLSPADDDDLLFNASLSSHNNNLSSTSNRRRLWPDVRHYDTIDMTHLIVNTSDSSQPFEAYSYPPTLHEYHDFISQRLSFSHDTDDTLLILGNAETSLLDLEDGRRHELLHLNSNTPAAAAATLESNHGTITTISSHGPNVTTSSTTTSTIPENGNPGEDAGQTDHVMDTINRLRCIFSCVTLPIVPIGSVLSMTLFYVIYAAFVLDVHQNCSHPMKLYTIYSMALFLYIPQHKTIKTLLFRYHRERDGPHVPIGVKVWDQLFYLVCLIYLSAGIDLVQGCMEDLVKTDSTTTSFFSQSLSLSDENKTQGGGVSSCAITCPHLYSATKLYVTILQLFAFAMLLPIVFLPCIYAYIIRRVHRGVESILLQSILRRGGGGDAFRSNSDDGIGDGITVQEIMDTLQQVRLVFVKDSNTTKGMDPLVKKVQIIYNSNIAKDSDNSDIQNRRGKITDWENVKDCCICMSDLVVSDEPQNYIRNAASYETIMDTSSSSTMLSPLLAAIEDESKGESVEEGQQQEQQQQRNTTRGSISDDTIVQTKCGHLFHQSCLGGWIGGSWEDPNNTSSTTVTQLRRARRRCCPLCREDLAPPTHP